MDSEYGGIFFYGVHLLQPLMSIFGKDIERVRVTRNGQDGSANLVISIFFTLLKRGFMKHVADWLIRVIKMEEDPWFIYFRQKVMVNAVSMKVRFQLAFLLLIFIVANPVSGQKKIYILTDLEGVSGVYKFAQTREKDTPLNIKACEYFMDDLSAVISGLKEGGATDILVIDGHGNQCVIPHMMEPGVKYLTGLPRPSTYWGLDSSWVGMVQFGAHAMNGTADGVLHHTMSSKSESKYWYNGIEVGEVVQCATIAGYYGIPTILVTGDEAVCRETKRFLGNACVTVAVKKGISREAAILYPFEETRKALYEGARKAMEAIPDCRPFTMDLPVRGKMQYLKLDSDTSEPKLVTKEAIFSDPRDILKF